MNDHSSFSSLDDGAYALRGTPISTLIREGDFVSTLWCTWTGIAPSPQTRRVLEACLVACIDHGSEPPSAQVARTVASCGKPLADSVAAGLLTLGSRHGNAGGAAAQWMYDALASGYPAEEVLRLFTERGERIPGIGHPVYESDPRTEVLFEVARAASLPFEGFDLITAVARLLSAQKGKTMPVNVDGAIGAIVVALGAVPACADALFLVARSVGLVAHAWEEVATSASYRRGGGV